MPKSTIKMFNHIYNTLLSLFNEITYKYEKEKVLMTLKFIQKYIIKIKTEEN